MAYLLPALVILLAVFTHSLSGFGIALVAMALLPNLVGIQIATPMVALVAITIEIFLLIRYREALNLKAVRPLALSSILGVPIGVWALSGLDERVALVSLGVVISGYAIYALLRLRLPELHNPLWAWGAGLMAGILGGAYNTTGPPVILYGNCKDWPPAEFKSNLQGFFLVSSLFITISHALAGNFTPTVWRYYLWTLPAIAVGILAGISLDRYLDPERFRRVVLVLLVIMGIKLILS